VAKGRQRCGKGKKDWKEMRAFLVPESQLRDKRKRPSDIPTQEENGRIKWGGGIGNCDKKRRKKLNGLQNVRGSKPSLTKSEKGGEANFQKESWGNRAMAILS